MNMTEEQAREAIRQHVAQRRADLDACAEATLHNIGLRCIGELYVALQLAAEDAGTELPDNFAKLDTPEREAWVCAVEEETGCTQSDLRYAVANYCQREALPLIAREHPEVTDYLTLPNFYPMRCDAWHNNAALLYTYTNACFGLQLWIDATDKENSEFSEQSRFGFGVFSMYDEESTDECLTEMEAETLAELPSHIEMIKRYAAPTREALARSYQLWLTRKRLPQLSADELIHHDTLSDTQRRFLTRFILLWDACHD